MEHFSLFYKKQFGFRKKHSTIDALIELMEKVRLFGAKNTSCFFIDLKKAFDTIDHSILLFKLEKYGIRGQAHHWFTSYLLNRKQRVEVNGSSSNWKRIVCGVPQGSILGPLLFLIYINDLPSSCQNLDILLFADDTNLTAINCSNEDIDRDLESLSNWLEANKLVLNLEKTVQMNIGNSASSSHKLNNQVILINAVCKYLGLYVDNRLNFSSHIDYVKMRLSKQCWIVSKLRHYVPRNLLIEYYKSNVNPIIQYGVIVYGCCSFSSLQPILRLQKKILKFIYFRKNYSNSDDNFVRNKLLTVYEFQI